MIWSTNNIQLKIRGESGHHFVLPSVCFKQRMTNYFCYFYHQITRTPFFVVAQILNTHSLRRAFCFYGSLSLYKLSRKTLDEQAVVNNSQDPG